MRRARREQEGQSMVEFAMIVTVLLLILSGMLEFGLLFDQHLTLETATREGARVGSALVNGGGKLGCGNISTTGESPNRATVDPQIIAAVQRVLESPGSRVDKSQIAQIKIFKAKGSDLTGDQEGTKVNTWIPDPGNGPSIDGANLDFRLSGSAGWDACTRTNGFPADSIGVSLTYTYRMVTPLPAALKFFGGGLSQFTINDRSVMAMNPT
jgi:hypothetical protein